MASEISPDGIYTDFPGYRLPDESELDAALGSALVVVDANVLLNLYRYNESTRNDLLGVLESLANRLWVPNQVLREFWRNRLSVIASRGASTEQAISALSRQGRATTDAIQSWAKATALETEERDELIGKVTTLYSELESEIKARAPTSMNVALNAGSDAVLAQLEKLLIGKVGSASAEADWKAAVKEGSQRVQRRQPPGYLDADKQDSELPEAAAGDYLVWWQTIEESGRRGVDVLLITGDEKEDWWWRYRSDLLGPRAELVAELKARTGRQLYMMRPIDILKRASALDVTVRQESVEDVERVSRENEQASVSTPEDSEMNEEYLIRGTTVDGKAELVALFERWVKDSSAETIGDAKAYGGAPWVWINFGDRRAFLNADTRRSAILAYLEYARHHGADAEWWVGPNRNGRINKVTYGEPGTDSSYWYCYLEEPLSEPSML